jgi:hypothetical protein
MNAAQDSNSYDEGDTHLKFSDLFELNRVLGNGAFGKVVSVKQKSNQKNYAVKVTNMLCYIDL